MPCRDPRGSHRAWSPALAGWLALVALTGPAHAQVAVQAVVTSPPSPVGAGARAAGVGNAFIALADDATAASWNPAGLVQLERPEISAVGLGAYQIDAIGNPSTDAGPSPSGFEVGTQTTGSASLNYLSAALPFSWRGVNIVASINYQQMLNFDRDFDYTRTTLGEDVATTRTGFEQSGDIYAFTPAVALELGTDLSLGAALNYWFDGIGRSYAWRRDARNDFTLDAGPNAFSTSMRSTTTYENFRGINGTFGVLWRGPSGVNLGAVVNLPFGARFTASLAERTTNPGGEDQVATAREPGLAMKLPLSYGFGASWRPIDECVLSLDVTRVHWDQFRVRDAAGVEFKVTGDEADQVSVDAVTTVRLGAEYLLLLEDVLLALRGGAFYDPDPSRGSPERLWGASLGLGATFDDLSLDLAYQLRFGLDVEQVSVLDSLFVPDAGFDLFQNLFYLSLVYYL